MILAMQLQIYSKSRALTCLNDTTSKASRTVPSQAGFLRQYLCDSEAYVSYRT